MEVLDTEEKVLAWCEGSFLVPGFGPKTSDSGEWRMLFDRENISRIELSQEGEVFKLAARNGATQGRALLLVPLTNVSYKILHDTWHEVEVQDGRKFALSLKRGDRCQLFLTILKDALSKIKELKAARFSRQSLTGVDSEIEAAVEPQLEAPPVTIMDGAEIQSLIQNLKLAIANGNAARAEQSAGKLASLYIKLNILEEQPPLNPAEQEISVKIYIEDKEASAGPMIWQLKPSMTIKALKFKMLNEHGFPLEVQRWIIGQRIAKDQETLLKCGVKTSGISLFLYLVSASTVGQKKPDFIRRHGHEVPPGLAAYRTEEQENTYLTLNEGAYMTMNGPNPGHRTPLTSAPPPLPPRNKPSPPLAESRSQGQRDADDYEVPIPSGNLDAAVAAAAAAAAATPVAPLADETEPEGWACPTCTFINQPTRPGCEQCTTGRPRDYIVPANYTPNRKEQERLQKEQELERLARQVEDDERQQNFDLLLLTEGQDLVPNHESFNCGICFDGVDVGEGVMLRECLHCFCRSCLVDHIRYCEEAVVTCPYNDGAYTCDAAMQDREIKALVPPNLFERHLVRSLDIAEHQAANSYHCETTDCHGWCLYEDQVNFFNCQVCGKQNCLTCKAIHEGMNCREYQDDIRIKAANDVAARETQQMLENMLSQGEAMRCPACNIVVQKKDGCDWIRCTMCKMEICWVTKGPRWGPQGTGDTTGGCKCGVNSRKCHPACNNCH